MRLHSQHLLLTALVSLTLAACGGSGGGGAGPETPPSDGGGGAPTAPDFTFTSFGGFGEGDLIAGAGSVDHGINVQGSTIEQLFPVSFVDDENNPQTPTYRSVYFRNPKPLENPDAEKDDLRVTYRWPDSGPPSSYVVDLTDGTYTLRRVRVEKAVGNPYATIKSSDGTDIGEGIIFPHGMVLLINAGKRTGESFLGHTAAHGNELTVADGGILQTYESSNGYVFGLVASSGYEAGSFYDESATAVRNFGISLRIDSYNQQSLKLIQFSFGSGRTYTGENFDNEGLVSFAQGTEADPRRNSFAFDLGVHGDFESGSVISGRFFGGRGGASDDAVSIGGVYAIQLTTAAAGGDSTHYWGVYALVPERP